MFDETITRWGTHSAKWDLLAAHLGEDALSLSVADMEFATCPEVSRAIVAGAYFGDKLSLPCRTRRTSRRWRRA